MLKTSLLSIALVLSAAILGAGGQFLFHQAAKSSRNALNMLVNPWALVGMLSYATVMLLFTQAFRLGGTVKVLYPLYATTFIWAALMGWVLYDADIRPVHAMGMALLMAGIVCMSW